MSKASRIKILKAAHHVKCTMIGGLALDDWPPHVATLVADGWTDHGTKITKGQRFILRPKLSRVRIGAMTFQSKEYEFTWSDPAWGHGEPLTSYGRVVDLNEAPTGLKLVMANGAVLLYEVAE